MSGIIPTIFPLDAGAFRLDHDRPSLACHYCARPLITTIRDTTERDSPRRHNPTTQTLSFRSLSGRILPTGRTPPRLRYPTSRHAPGLDRTRPTAHDTTDQPTSAHLGPTTPSWFRLLGSIHRDYPLHRRSPSARICSALCDYPTLRRSMRNPVSINK